MEFISRSHHSATRDGSKLVEMNISFLMFSNFLMFLVYALCIAMSSNHYLRQCSTAYSNGINVISDPKVFTLNGVRWLLPVNSIYPKQPYTIIGGGGFRLIVIGLLLVGAFESSPIIDISARGSNAFILFSRVDQPILLFCNP